MARTFISSTYRDLVAERTAVIDALAPTYEIRNMENFGSKPGTPLSTCLNALDDSDTCTLIVGHRYGSIIPQGHVSYTEAEYEHAQATGVPVFAYIRSDFDTGVAASSEDAATKAKLHKLRVSVEAEVTVDPVGFATGAQLATKALRDLDNWFSGSARPTFRRKPFDIVDRAAYAVEVVRRAQYTLLAPRIVLVDTAAVDLQKTPPAESGGVTRKILQIEKELREAGFDVVLFTNLPAAPDGESALDQRLHYLRAARDVVVVFFSRDAEDLKTVELFTGGDMTRFLWYRDVGPPESLDIYQSRQWVTPDLRSCQLAIDVQTDLLQYIGNRVMTAMVAGA